MTAYPLAAICFDVRVGFSMDPPIIERSLSAGLAGHVPPPARLAIYDSDIGRDMAALEQGHPHVARSIELFVFGNRVQHSAACPHALQIDDGFGKNRVARRRRAVRTGIEVF